MTTRIVSSLLALVMLLTGCGVGGGGRATPEEALVSFQAALRAGAADGVLRLQDADTRAYFRQKARSARAELEAGRELADPELQEPELTAALRTGTLEDVAALLAMRGSHMNPLRGWIEECKVVGRNVVRDESGRQLATLSVRAVDGGEHDVYLVHEPEGWAFDAFRHYQVAISRR